MVLDITDDILRDHFSNVQCSVMGERTLLEKLLPVIDLRESKLEQYFLPSCMFKDKGLKKACIDVVAYGALYDGFPMLDVVLTPNGLATVGNNNLNPASATRSEAARKSLGDLLFAAEEHLIAILRKNMKWLISKWAKYFSRTLFVSLRDLCALHQDRTSESFDLAMEMQKKAAIVEERLAQRYISLPLMRHLRFACLAERLSYDEHYVVDRIQDAVRISLQTDGKSGEMLIDVVDYIRKHPRSFPLWKKSDVAQTFQDHSYKNKKESSGFFF